jgi:hypothetical protein
MLPGQKTVQNWHSSTSATKPSLVLSNTRLSEALNQSILMSLFFRKLAKFKLFQKQDLQGAYEEVPSSSNLLFKDEKEGYDVGDVRPEKRPSSVSRLPFHVSLLLFAFSLLVLIAARYIRPSDSQCARQLSVWCKSSQRVSEAVFNVVSSWP